MYLSVGMCLRTCLWEAFWKRSPRVREEEHVGAGAFTHSPYRGQCRHRAAESRPLSPSAVCGGVKCLLVCLRATAFLFLGATLAFCSPSAGLRSFLFWGCPGDGFRSAAERAYSKAPDSPYGVRTVCQVSPAMEPPSREGLFRTFQHPKLPRGVSRSFPSRGYRSSVF